MPVSSSDRTGNIAATTLADRPNFAERLMARLGVPVARRPLAPKARRAVAGAVVETMESRQMLSVVQLTSGYTPGGAVVNVDAFGAFGLSATGKATQVTDFTVGDGGVVDRSYVYFGPARSFLVEPLAPTDTDPTLAVGGFGATISPLPITPSASLPAVDFSAVTPSSAQSSFVLEGTDPDTQQPYKYQVTLVQSLSTVLQTPASQTLASLNPGTTTPLFQTTLTQSYTFLNLLGTDSAFTVARYYAPTDSPFSTSAATYFSNAGQLASLSTPSTALFLRGLDNTQFVQLGTSGGTFNAAGGRFSSFDAALQSNGAIPANQIGLDFETTPGYSPFAALDVAQQQTLSVGGRQSATFVATTTFGDGTPLLLSNASGDTTVVLPGDFAFSSPTYNYTLDSATSTGSSLLVTVNRLGAATGATSVLISPAETNPGNPLLTGAQTVNFVDGQTQALVAFPLARGFTDIERVQLTISPTGAGGLANPIVANLTVVPARAAFNVSAATVSASATQASVPVTINRTGNPNGAAAVTLSVPAGATVLNDDGSAAGATRTITFADGQTSAVVNVRLAPVPADGATRTYALTLASATAAGTTLASVVNDKVAAPLISLTSTDANGPTISNLSTALTRNRITGVVLNFSEPLRPNVDPSVFSLFTRSSEGAFGTARLKAVEIASAVYDAAARTVTVIPAKPLSLNKSYTIRVAQSAGLTDVQGNVLNFVPGTDSAGYSVSFARGNRVSYVDRDGDTVTLSARNGTFDLVRTSDGEASSVTLFGSPATLFSGSVRRNRATSILLLSNTVGAQVQLPANITVGAAS